MKEITLHSAIAELSPEDFAHPGLRVCKFIFCDDQPNDNDMGIEFSDFDEIKRSAIGTPVKMKFLGNTAGGHAGSVPIGFIKNIYDNKTEDGVNQLVADAILFADEYPDEIDYISTKFAEGEAPGLSWELRYSDSVIKDGIEWLKGLVTRAATFVRNPAYGNRTAILALASNKNIDETQLMQELSEIVQENSSSNEGGKTRMDEQEIKELKEKLANIESLLAEKESEITDLNSKIGDLSTALSERDNTINEYKQKEVLASRIAALAEAGIPLPTEPEKLAAKEALIAKLDDDAFAAYKADLAEAIAEAKKGAQTKEGLASLRRSDTGLPKFDATASEGVDLSDLRDKLRLNRTRVISR